MTIESDIDDKLKLLVNNRVFAILFPQPPERPVWPAIRRTMWGVPSADLCGDGGDEAADFRLQLDIVVSDSAGYTALRTLRDQVKTAMATLDPPAVWDGERIDLDEETRTLRCSLDYMIYQST